MQPLDYSNKNADARPRGTASAIASFCIGLVVSTEGLWAIVIMRGLERHGDADAWMILGSLLLMGAIAAAIGLAFALYGRIIKAPPHRLRALGEILNAVYLLGYAALLAIVAIWR